MHYRTVYHAYKIYEDTVIKEGQRRAEIRLAHAYRVQRDQAQEQQSGRAKSAPIRKRLGRKLTRLGQWLEAGDAMPDTAPLTDSRI
jgi:hypothetical protein